MKKILFYGLFFMVVYGSNAQQVPMYSHYFYKPMLYNPAFTGTSDTSNAFLISRSQWADFKGSPQLTFFTLDGNIKDKKAGLGLGLISDRKGISSRVGGNISYSYKLNVTEKSHIFFGISLGMIDQTIDFSKALVEKTDDPVLFSDAQHKTFFDANAGLAFIWKGLELSAAVPQLFGNKVQYVDNNDVRSYYTQTRHYLGSVKYKFYLSKEKYVSLAPQGLVRFVPNTPVQFDGNINLDWNEKFWIGATYKSDYAIGAHAGICLYRQLYLGYSYDFIIGNIGKYAGISNEIMLNYKFWKNKKPETCSAELSACDKSLDSLETQYKINQDKLNELRDKLIQQTKIRPLQVKNNENNNLPEDDGPNMVMENGVWIINCQSKNFKDRNDQAAKKGIYVIVGTYYFQYHAVSEAKRFFEIGYNESDFIKYNAVHYSYVFLSKPTNKEQAFEKVKEAKKLGVSDSWVLVLTD